MRILHWFRKDLRLDDNTALSEAAHDAAGDVVPFHAEDPAAPARPDASPARARFERDARAALDADLRRLGSSLGLARGDATEVVVDAAHAARADAVYWNDEYEPRLRERDDRVERALRASGVEVKRFHDRLLVAPGEALTREGRPYTVYTAFRRTCEALPVSAPHPAPVRLAAHARPPATADEPGPAPPGAATWPAGGDAARSRLRRFVSGTGNAPPGLAGYERLRDLPAARAGSRLSADLEFGTIGVRRVVAEVRAAAAAEPSFAAAAEKFVAELRWRDFHHHVLFHFPHVEHGCFRREYDAIEWPGTPEHRDAWRGARTGVPIVDAGMRELHATGFMHNRVRMLAASFLVKDLLVDWREGERHFMRHLIDGNLANNNGGWQWTAGTGTDAAPFFRVFNPVVQGERFDAGGAYVRRWLPELERVPDAFVHRPWEATAGVLAAAGVVLGETYPRPLVDHAAQRDRALALYRAVR